MKKRFIVAIETASNAEHEAFMAMLRNKQLLGWWHWIDGIYLIIDSKGQLTATQLRDSVTELYNNRDCFIVELRADGTSTWSGYGPRAANKDMFEWIHKYWSA